MSHHVPPTAIALALIISASGCVTARATFNAAPTGMPPGDILGAFEDDYGGVYQITTETWRHGATAAYDIVAWHADSQYVVARNAPGNPTAPMRWTRIDWMPLANMSPYTWAFCFTAYDAPSRAAAESAPTAVRASPRSGCNSYPFSRMKRRTD
ncbi:hypothetical protein [Gemmatimonas sp.]|uniref:hypothetical protein n=1 Tax=Gemmatimonas sp. TaxID=1962908 RepID=UPI003983426E